MFKKSKITKQLDLQSCAFQYIGKNFYTKFVEKPVWQNMFYEQITSKIKDVTKTKDLTLKRLFTEQYNVHEDEKLELSLNEEISLQSVYLVVISIF